MWGLSIDSILLNSAFEVLHSLEGASNRAEAKRAKARERKARLNGGCARKSEKDGVQGGGNGEG